MCDRRAKVQDATTFASLEVGQKGLSEGKWRHDVHDQRVLKVINVQLLQRRRVAYSCILHEQLEFGIFRQRIDQNLAPLLGSNVALAQFDSGRARSGTFCLQQKHRTTTTCEDLVIPRKVVHCRAQRCHDGKNAS